MIRRKTGISRIGVEIFASVAIFLCSKHACCHYVDQLSDSHVIPRRAYRSRHLVRGTTTVFEGGLPPILKMRLGVNSIDSIRHKMCPLWVQSPNQGLL